MFWTVFAIGLFCLGIWCLYDNCGRNFQEISEFFCEDLIWIGFILLKWGAGFSFVGLSAIFRQKMEHGKIGLPPTSAWFEGSSSWEPNSGFFSPTNHFIRLFPPEISKQWRGSGLTGSRWFASIQDTSLWSSVMKSWRAGKPSWKWGPPRGSVVSNPECHFTVRSP